MVDIIILTEKPSASLKIAHALSDKTPKKKDYQKVPYYEIEHNKKKILILCAVGHLYNVAEKEKGKWVYPFFDYTWKESYLTQKTAAFSKKYLDAINKLKDPKAEIYMATDKDLEGEILGYNIIRFALKRKDAKRMEFSTMTSKDLKKAFENPKPHLDFPLINSGEARHILDFLWGLNLSRALTLEEKNAVVIDLTKKEVYQEPPAPFDLTSLQLESYRVFGITPKETLSLAQELYTNAYISYPRTSSNQLPESLNYKEILMGIGKQKQYLDLVKNLLSRKQLKPNNGNKTDPAHPAIYPTGEIPKKLKPREHKIYDLVDKRTLATFADKAKRETITLESEIKKEPFIAKASRTIE